MTNFLFSLLNILIYFAIMASLAIICRLYIKIPDEIFRKSLHFILLGSLCVWVISFKIWWHSAIVAIGFAVIVYPILLLCERIKNYSKIVTERKSGELKASLLIVFGMFAIIICICQGIFNDKYLVLASVYSWGIGDAMAALVGKRFGKHKIKGKFLKGNKSYEGTFAMFVSSVVSVFIVLFLRGNLSVYGLIFIPIIVGAISATVELFTKNGFDTITCPTASMVTLLGLLYLFGGLIV